MARRTRSFRTTVFYAILGVAMVPTGLALFGGIALLQEFGTSTGTLGPWDAVAESGRQLIDTAQDPEADSAALAAAIEQHQSELSASVRRSRIYAVVTDRISALLPVGGVMILLVLGGLASWVALRISRRLGDPVHELVTWSDLIARRQPLPEEDLVKSGVKEFRVLRRAMTTMDSDLRAARARDVEAARMRAWTEMARRVAHELKNPLTPIRMSASSLARSDDAGVRDSASLILEEAARLDEMARTFAQLGKPTEGPMAPVDFRELVESLIRTHEVEGAIAHETSGDLPLVLGDHEALRRAVGNLLVNAREATGPDGVVRISARADDTHLHLEVADDGPGIPEEFLDRIWLPDVTTRVHGSGLGLAIVRQTVAAHGGEAVARNLAAGGAVFTLSLPLEGPDDHPASDTHSTTATDHR